MTPEEELREIWRLDTEGYSQAQIAEALNLYVDGRPNRSYIQPRVSVGRLPKYIQQEYLKLARGEDSNARWHRVAQLYATPSEDLPGVWESILNGHKQVTPETITDEGEILYINIAGISMAEAHALNKRLARLDIGVHEFLANPRRHFLPRRLFNTQIRRDAVHVLDELICECNNKATILWLKKAINRIKGTR